MSKRKHKHRTRPQLTRRARVLRDALTGRREFFPPVLDVNVSDLFKECPGCHATMLLFSDMQSPMEPACHWYICSKCDYMQSFTDQAQQVCQI